MTSNLFDYSHLEATPAQFDRNGNIKPMADERCFLCNRPVNEATSYWVHLSTSNALFPVGEEVTTDERYDQGWFPIGSECGKKVPAAYRTPHATLMSLWEQ